MRSVGLAVMNLALVVVALEAPADPAETITTPRMLASGLPRIVGGTEATEYEFPWLVRLYYSNSNNDGGFCGGTLIASTWVLTAAHCIDSPNDAMYIGVHKHSLFAGGDTSEDCAAVIPSKSVECHEDYSATSLYNDICLIELEYAPPMGNDCSTRPLELDDGLYWPGYTSPPIAEATVAGWGSPYYGGDQMETLQKVEIELYTFDQCNGYGFSVYGDSFFDPYPGMCCAGDYGTPLIDSCQGDSGGPLFVSLTDNDEGTQQHILVGVVSWGIGDPACGDEDYPGVYARVAYYRDWISERVPDAVFVGPSPATTIEFLFDQYAGEAGAVLILPDGTEIAPFTFTADGYISDSDDTRLVESIIENGDCGEDLEGEDVVCYKYTQIWNLERESTP
jgi:secreted trypsin-like serine protease